MDYQIKWKQGDFIKLGQAVSQFNKKVKKLQTEENKLYLPEELNYKDIKNNIFTRKELNRMINSLRNFQEKGAEEIIETTGEEKITKWEYSELKKQQKTALKNLTKQLNKEFQPTVNGYSKAQMGSLEYNQLEKQIANIKKLDFVKGSELKRVKDRIKNAGRLDYSMKKAIIYRNNYINEMKKYSSFKNYDKLMNYLENIKNPIKFYEKLSENEIIADLTYQSDEYYSQMEFNRFVEEVIGEEIEQNDNIDEFMDFKYELKTGDEIEF